MFSVITKFKNFLPFKIENIKPTKEGKITELFDVTLIGFFFYLTFAIQIFHIKYCY